MVHVLWFNEAIYKLLHLRFPIMLRLYNFYVLFVYLVLNGLSTSSPSDSTSIIFLVSFHEFPNNFLRCLYHEKIGRQMFFPELCKRDPDREAGKKISREKQSRLLACIFEADYGNVRSAIVCVYSYVHICVYVGRARISSFLGNHGPEVTRKIISPKTGYTGSIYAIERRVASHRGEWILGNYKGQSSTSFAKPDEKIMDYDGISNWFISIFISHWTLSNLTSRKY